MIPASPKHAQGDDPLAAYDYPLPARLIAQTPARRRVQAKLLVLERQGANLIHGKVAGLTKLLRPGDLLVLNQTQVVPARLMARKPSGGRVELLLLSPSRPEERLPAGGELHRCLLRCHRPLRPGQRLRLEGEPGLWLTLQRRRERGQALVEFPGSALAVAQQRGQTPLPPYINRPQGPSLDDRRRYQTVYAASPGAVAAPTAGLHLSQELLAALARRGIQSATLTLHVGYGTFAEPSAQDLAAGRLHPEWVELPAVLSRAVARTRRRGGRVIAVGTTSLRALEWRAGPGGVPQPGEGWCDLLIGPGHRFRVADGLLTNFHLPRTTLLMLVAALAGRERVLRAYAEAVRQEYRFYSFGDAMLIL